MSQSHLSKSQAFWLTVFCVEVLCFSGGNRFNLEYPRTCLVVWLATGLIVIGRFSTNPKALRSNLLVALALGGWAFMSTRVMNGFYSGSVLRFIIYPAGTALAISSLDFHVFRHRLLTVANWIFAFSILVHLAAVFDLVPIYQVEIGKTREMSLYFFNTKWGDYDLIPGYNRFSAIYWEPGQCQIVITYLLVMFSDVISDNILRVRWLLRRFGILFVAMVMTCSTMGYIVFALFIFCMLVWNKVSRTNVALWLVCVLVGIGTAFTIYDSSVVQDKLSQSQDDSERTSYAIRMADNLGCLAVAMESPVYGGGVETPNVNRRLLNEGSETSSNGWLSGAAQLGFVYLAYLLALVFLGVRRMRLGPPSLALFSILVMSQCNEACICYPYMWLYVFNYKSYRLKGTLAQ